MQRVRGRPRLGHRPEEQKQRLKALIGSSSGFTLAEVARALDVSPRTVQLWSRSARTNDRFARIADVLPRLIQCAREENDRESAFS